MCEIYEIIECHTFDKYKNKHGEIILKPKIVKYKRKQNHTGRPSIIEITDDLKEKVIYMNSLPYNITFKEMSNQTGLTPYQIKKIIWEFENN